jgi:GGDEF domain-containing protein
MNPERDRYAGEQSSDSGWLEGLLHRLLMELEGLERRAVVGGASRRLIQHGRSLDALLWRAHRLWNEHNRRESSETLSALCQTLVEAHAEAEALRVALLVSTAPLHPPWDVPESTADDRPSPGGTALPPEEVVGEFGELRRRLRDLLELLEKRRQYVEPPLAEPPAPVTEPSNAAGRADSAGRVGTEEALEAGTTALEGLLWRITADWQHLQRSPTPDRIAVLCAELERASEQVRQLADDIGRASRRPEGASPTATAGQTHAPFRDVLTGALNREGFDVMVIGELKRSRRYRRPFTLLLVELRESDQHSLTGSIDRLTAGLRGSDFIGRYVDRLVAVGLPETSSEAALAAARRVMRSLPAGAGGRAPPRIGLASLPEDGRTLAELVSLARRQLNEEPLSLGESGTDYWGV